jgi:hypothetical protein
MGPLLEFAEKFMFFDGFSNFQNDWKCIEKLQTKDVYQGPFKWSTFHFSIHVDSDLKWKDSKFALFCLQNFDHSQHLEFALLLCSC